jgi:hypothetical protein
MANWTDRLKERWNLKNTWQVVLVLIVFACTGTTVLLIKKPLFELWFPDGVKPVWASIAYYILIFPIYNLFLLGYGFLFGQFKFFWEFEKKTFRRMFGKKSQQTA